MTLRAALHWTIKLGVLGLMVFPVIGRAQSKEKVVDFNRHIRPILSNRCYRCHGPDISTREAELRLDQREFAILDVIVPGDAKASELMVRISTEDIDDRMPPEDAHKPALTKEEIEHFRVWINAGAKYDKHWAFVPPQTGQSLPETKADWGNGAIDRFVLANLEANGLTPSRRAARHTLLRRVTFDLTGLPPTPAELRTFLNDTSRDAYQKAVDRLLNSVRYGEHMGRYWLDAARYADTHGLHLDNYREMFPFRDWVVNAFNANQPYDQFITEQIAGDLLPEATREQRIASGFNRCHVTTNEGGSITEEVRVRNIYDRVDTFGTIFWGMTVGCAKCHDHKFDPISQKEYFELYAFFNSLDAKAMDGNNKIHAPVVKVASVEDEAELERLAVIVAKLKADVDGPIPEVDAAQKKWEASWAKKLKGIWEVSQVKSVLSKGGETLTIQPNGSILTSGKQSNTDTYELVLRTDRTNINAIRLEALTHKSLTKKSLSRSNGNFVLTEFEAEITPATDPKAKPSPVHFAHARATYSQPTYPVEGAIDGKFGKTGGWAVNGHSMVKSRTALFQTDAPFGFEGGTLIRFRLRFESRFPKHSIGNFRLSVSESSEILSETLSPWFLLGHFQSDSAGAAFNTAFGPEKGVDLVESYLKDTLHWTKKPEFVDAKTHSLSGGVGANYLYRTITSPTARQVEVSLGSDDGIRVWLNSSEVLSNQIARGVAADQERITLDLKKGENHLLLKIVNSGGATGFYFRLTNKSSRPTFAMTELLGHSASQRDKGELKELQQFFREFHSPKWSEFSKELKATEKKRADLDASLPTTLVYKETKMPRKTFLLERGEYREKGEEVTRSTPAFLPDFPKDLPKDRLGLAKWLLQPNQPLTARIAVNRFWLQVFGQGLVETAEDFGNQGSLPSHSELLDWLSVQFRNGGWNVKDLMRQIVTSATYQQSSAVSEKLVKLDPKNTHLARGPRFRLDAEMIRDQALALGGLLYNKLGGRSVKPPQPDGLWFEIAMTSSNTRNFKADTTHEKVHRRTLYTFLKRTSQAPQMIDAPTRQTCIVRRERTNSPLHALLLMNDPQFVEAARGLARRMMTEGGPTPAEKAAHGYSLATGHPPGAVEGDTLRSVFDGHLQEFRANPETANLLNSVGLKMTKDELPADELAAWTMVANLILNLDEVLNKN